MNMNRGNELYLSSNGRPRATTPQRLSPKRRTTLQHQQQFEWERQRVTQSPTKRVIRRQVSKRALSRTKSNSSIQMFPTDCRKTVGMQSAQGAPFTPRRSPTKTKLTAGVSRTYSMDSAATPTTHTMSTMQDSSMATPSTRLSNNNSPRRVSSSRALVQPSPPFASPAVPSRRRTTRAKVVEIEDETSYTGEDETSYTGEEQTSYTGEEETSYTEDDETTYSDEDETEDEPTNSEAPTFSDFGFEEPNFDLPAEPELGKDFFPPVDQFFLFESSKKGRRNTPDTSCRKKPVSKQTTEMEKLERAVQRGRELAIQGYKTASAVRIKESAHHCAEDHAGRNSMPQLLKQIKSQRTNSRASERRSNTPQRGNSQRRLASAKMEQQMHQKVPLQRARTAPPRSKSTVREKSVPRNTGKHTRTKSADWYPVASEPRRNAETRKTKKSGGRNIPPGSAKSAEELMNSYGEQSFSQLVSRQRSNRGSGW